MPPASTAAQRSAIADFTGVTQANATVAAKILKQHNWNVPTAINAFFSNPTGAPNPHRATVSKVFDKYRDNVAQAPDEIGVEGIQRLFQDADIDMEGVGAFVFFELVSAPAFGSVTREGFVDGWSDVGVDTLPKMRTTVLQRQSQLATDKNLFKKVYNHAFVLALQEKQKSAPMEMAFEFWKVLLRAPSLAWQTERTPWLDWYMEFYEDRVKKAVNKDLWKQTLNFAYESLADESLGFWSEESSWPSVIDEFVEWVKAKREAGGENAMEIS